MKISEPTVLLSDFTARPTRTGFVAVWLGTGCDLETFTPEMMAAERAKMPNWRYEKEYLGKWDAQNGRPVFAEEWLAVQTPRLHNPLYTMDLVGGKLAKVHNGRVRIYIEPDYQPEHLPNGMTVEASFGIGMDVGEGVGGSNSALQVLLTETREQAAEFADNTITPADFGRLAAEVARFYNNGLICCVRKMHGITAIRAMIDAGYYQLWRHKIEDQPCETNTQKLGWARGEMSDKLLAGRHQDAIQYDRVKLRSITTLEEHRQYIYDELGRICHRKLKDLPQEVRHNHGDLVVAMALAEQACVDMPLYQSQKTTPPPLHSIAYFDEQEANQVQEVPAWRK